MNCIWSQSANYKLLPTKHSPPRSLSFCTHILTKNICTADEISMQNGCNGDRSSTAKHWSTHHQTQNRNTLESVGNIYVARHRSQPLKQYLCISNFLCICCDTEKSPAANATVRTIPSACGDDVLRLCACVWGQMDIGQYSKDVNETQEGRTRIVVLPLTHRIFAIWTNAWRWTLAWNIHAFASATNWLSSGVSNF